ncbi:MAG: hypothetical protein NXI24_23850 [bacterium]|nr:hypothetical protein [bacterium]
MKSLVNFLYRVKSRKERFARRFPGEEILYASGSKGIRRKREIPVRIGPAWAFARRSVLILSTGRLVAGNWNIPLETIRAARLLRISGLFGSAGMILSVETNSGEYYQFGLMHHKTLLEQTALPLEQEDAKLQFSLLLFGIRLAATAYLAYIVLRTWL